MYTHVYVYVCIYGYTDICICICMYIYIHMYSHIHTSYIYMYSHTWYLVIYDICISIISKNGLIPIGVQTFSGWLNHPSAFEMASL